MDVAAALADLTEISSHVNAAVVLGGDEEVLASTFASDALAERLAAAARELLAAAADVPTGAGRQLTQLEVALPEGSVFVVRDASHTVAATTAASPISALVLYDLRTCLRALAEPETPEREPEPPKRKRRAAKATDA